MPRKNPSPTPHPFSSTIEFWEAYEQVMAGSPEKEGLRLRAVEWFRYESLKRSLLPLYRQFQAEKKKATKALGQVDNHRPFQFTELEKILRGEHHWLIGQGPPPKRGWVFPYFLPEIRKARAVQCVVQPCATSPLRLVLAINPLVDERTIQRGVKDAVMEHRVKHFQRLRAGGGKPYPLARLWRGLQAFDERMGGESFKNLGLKTGETPSKERGKKLFALGETMVQTAWRPASQRTTPHEWLDLVL